MSKFASKYTVPVSLAVSVAALLVATGVSAHAVVKPSEVGIGAFQTFEMGVPSEKPLATTSVRLVLPSGLNYVTPNVMPDWKITVVKNSSGAATEIDWKNGSIPAGERDDFIFSAQAPSSTGTLDWKVYQTYSDGSVVSWDQDPSKPQATDSSGKTDFSSTGPYSTTQIVNDLTGTTSSSDTVQKDLAAGSRKINIAIALSVIALVFSIVPFLKKYNKEDSKPDNV